MKNTIIISGGGVKGIAVLGLLHHLFEHTKELENVKKFIGTSIGGVIALMICIGYKPIDLLHKVISQKLIEKLKIINIVSMVNCSGAASFEDLQDFISVLLIEKNIDINITLKDIKKMFGNDLICSSYNFSKNQIEYISAENNPDITCIELMRLTCNIPLFFNKYKYKGDFYFDGGIYDNFPLSGADENTDDIIGLRIINKPNNIESETNILSFIMSIIFNISKIYTQSIIDKSRHKMEIIEINIQDIETLSLNVDISEILDLFSRGYLLGKEYYKTKNGTEPLINTL